MKQFTFATYEEYVEAQRITTLRRREKKAMCPTKNVNFTQPEVVAAIQGIQYEARGGDAVRRGVCHGAGHAEEIDMLEAALGGKWFGTDIVAEMCDGLRVVQWDFSIDRDDWRGAFDAIFTNALDHARFPRAAVAVWMGQLAPGGVLFVTWSGWHNKLSKHPLKRSDCFAASREEYRGLLGEFGQVIAEVAVVDANRVEHVVFAVGVDHGEIPT